jgi:hypothetical protein
MECEERADLRQGTLMSAQPPQGVLPSHCAVTLALVSELTEALTLILLVLQVYHEALSV